MLEKIEYMFSLHMTSECCRIFYLNQATVSNKYLLLKVLRNHINNYNRYEKIPENKLQFSRKLKDHVKARHDR